MTPLTASDQSRKHVTRDQMVRLEAGYRVKLNSAQLAELEQFKPEFVKITIHETSALMKTHVVSIENMEDRSVIPIETRDRIGITLMPDGTIVPTAAKDKRK